MHHGQGDPTVITVKGASLPPSVFVSRVCMINEVVNIDILGTIMYWVDAFIVNVFVT